MALRVAVTGASGRMGQAVARAVSAEREMELACLVARPGSQLVGSSAASFVGDENCEITVSDVLDLEAVDVVIDFTLPESSLVTARACAEAGVPIVIGTTGFSESEQVDLESSLTSVARCQAANFSTGVNLAYRLLSLAAQVMGADSDIEIHEAHHKHKIDAPSGTALAMGHAVADALGQSLSDVAHYDRSANREARAPGSIGFSVTRAGEIVGEHTVLFAADGERLEITHKAGSRDAFANGAVRAAKFIANKPAGAYTMSDVLGLS
jgi:4-hydroxy-tetrahydrodipicolinate reductase